MSSNTADIRTSTARLAGVGHYVPERRVSSTKIESELGLEPGWIERRTGIRERRVVADDEAASDMAIAAAGRALDDAALPRSEIGLLLLATSTPDHLLPPSAPLVTHHLGLTCGGVDVTGACAGFLYALTLADAFAHAQQRPALVVAANVLSRRVNTDHIGTAALFADAAGAVVLAPGTERLLRGTYLGTDGSSYDHIHIPAGGSRQPVTPDNVAAGDHLMHMERGPHLFRDAVRAMVHAGRHALDGVDLCTDDIDWWIPHQANQRITEQAGEELGIPMARTIDVIACYGNSSAATIPLALSLAIEDGRVRRGDTLLLTAVGSGMIEAGAVLTW